MNPEADDLYERLDAEPTETHSELKKKISAFASIYHGGDYHEESSEVQRHLNKEENRRKYNKKKGYPVDWDVDEIVDLTIEGPEIVEVGEPVTVVVTNGDDDIVEDAEVTVSGRDLGDTDNKGRCSFRFTDKNTFTVKANKDGSDAIRFNGDAHTIEVTKERRELKVTPDDTEITVGEPITFTVTDGDPVSDAVLKFPTGQKTTNSSGKYTHTFRKVDTFEVDVVKDDDDDVTYVSTTATVRVKPRTVSLTISADKTKAETGEPVTFRVVNGDPVEGASLSYGDETRKTGSDGRATVEFSKAGTVTVEATKSEISDTKYEKDSISINIDKSKRSLSVEPDTNPAKVGEPITVSVTDSSGRAIQGATVKGRDKSETTDASGKCTLTFSKKESVKLTATKDETEAATFERGTTNVSIEKRSKQLDVQPAETNIMANDPVDIKVRDNSGDSVADATVITPSSKDRSDKTGVCRVTFSTLGSVEVVARKDDTDAVTYDSDSTEVTVRPREVDLAVSTDKDEVEASKPVNVTVWDSDGNRIEGVEVVAGSESERTDHRGRCTISPESKDVVKVVAKKEDEPKVHYNSDTTYVDILLQERELSIDAPDEAPAGETVSVTVRDDEGNRIEGTVVSTPVDEAPTDDRGTCRLSLPDSSVAYLEAHKPASDTIKYNEARHRIKLTGESKNDGADVDDDGNKMIIAITAVVLAQIPFIGAFFALGLSFNLLVVFFMTGAIILATFYLSEANN